ncbi:MAG: HNH endonuclease [Planctomycetes bacterium]|nr:HNH endonuclease [Planctomycetota bacterium]
MFNFTFEVEHIVPTARGGADDPSNLALACRACNARKGDAGTVLDAETGETVALFDPRSDRWAEHFEHDPDSGAVNGLTAVGRATVVRLDMNHPLQLTARLLWVQLRLFP